MRLYIVLIAQKTNANSLSAGNTKFGEALPGAGAHLHPIDPRRRRTRMTPGFQRVQGGGGTCGFDGYGTVGVVAGVTGEAQALGFGAGALAEKHALNPAMNVKGAVRGHIPDKQKRGVEAKRRRSGRINFTGGPIKLIRPRVRRAGYWRWRTASKVSTAVAMLTLRESM